MISFQRQYMQQQQQAGVQPPPTQQQFQQPQTGLYWRILETVSYKY